MKSEKTLSIVRHVCEEQVEPGKSGALWRYDWEELHDGAEPHLPLLSAPFLKLHLGARRLEFQEVMWRVALLTGAW